MIAHSYLTLKDLIKPMKGLERIITYMLSGIKTEPQLEVTIRFVTFPSLQK